MTISNSIEDECDDRICDLIKDDKEKVMFLIRIRHFNGLNTIISTIMNRFKWGKTKANRLVNILSKGEKKFIRKVDFCPYCGTLYTGQQRIPIICKECQEKILQRPELYNHKNLPRFLLWPTETCNTFVDKRRRYMEDILIRYNKELDNVDSIVQK